MTEQARNGQAGRTSIRPRIAVLAALATVSLLSAVVALGYVAVVKTTRDSQIELIDGRLDILEERLATGDLRVTSQLDLDASLVVVRTGEAVPPRRSGTLRVERTPDIDGVDRLIGTVSTRQLDRTFSTIRTALWLSVAAAGLLVGLIAWVVVDRSLTPVRRLTRQARTIEGDRSVELLDVPESGDELSELATTFNTMITKLRTVDTERRRFVSDASHELRTPLMVLLADAEYASARPGADTELAESVTKQVERLTALVDDLLTLAAIDEGRTGEATMTIPELLEAASAQHLVTDLSPGIGDRQVPDVSRSLSNLITNAERHSTDDVEVQLEVDEGQQRLVLHVDDDGPGLPVAERTLVFKRFYRPDDGRARSSGGAGLGLAIAQAEVERAGGTVAFHESPLGGARVTISVPVDRPAVS